MQIQAGHLRNSGLTAWQQSLQGSQSKTGDAAQSASTFGSGLRVQGGTKAATSSEDFRTSLNANFASPQAAATDSTPSIMPTQPESTSDVFATIIGRQAVPDGTAADGAAAKDPSALIESLSGAMEFIRDKFGDDAATAAMGMVTKATSGGVTEDSLSNGLVDVLQFVENTFGQQATNSVMASFNGALNDEMNAFFDNGKVEKFLAVEDGQVFTPGDAELNAAAQATVISSLSNTSAADAADGSAASFEDMLSRPLEELQEDLEESTATQNPSKTAFTGDVASTASADFTAQVEPALLGGFANSDASTMAPLSFSRNPYDAMLAGQYAPKGQLLNLSA